MKRYLPLSSWLIVAIFAAAWSPLSAAEPKPGYVEFGQLAPAEEDGEFVEVVVSRFLISMAARLTENHEPEIAAILNNLEFVRVNVLKLDDKNRAEIEERFRSIGARLDAEGWERVVKVREAREQVNIHVKTRGEESVLGVLVTVLDGGNEAVFVNVVGDIKPEQLAVIGDRFDIEPLKKLRKVAKPDDDK